MPCFNPDLTLLGIRTRLDSDDPQVRYCWPCLIARVGDGSGTPLFTPSTYVVHARDDFISITGIDLGACDKHALSVREHLEASRASQPT